MPFSYFCWLHVVRSCLSSSCLSSSHISYRLFYYTNGDDSHSNGSFVCAHSFRSLTAPIAFRAPAVESCRVRCLGPSVSARLTSWICLRHSRCQPPLREATDLTYLSHNSTPMFAPVTPLSHLFAIAALPTPFTQVGATPYKWEQPCKRRKMWNEPPTLAYLTNWRLMNCMA